MRFSVLSSSSRANCTFIESGNTRILIDAGLSCRETERRLRMLGIDPASINAIIVTHEHNDHILGIPQICKRLKTPIYANRRTHSALPWHCDVTQFQTNEPFEIGDFLFNPFPIAHDAADPVGLRIQADGWTFVQVTDLGHVTDTVRSHIEGCNALVLESNHDVEMLWQCHYSWPLKKRIASSHGHLSNEEAGTLLQESLHEGLMHVVLAHISENSNTPKLAMETVGNAVSVDSFLSFVCGSRYESTPMIRLGERLLLDEVI